MLYCNILFVMLFFFLSITCAQISAVPVFAPHLRLQHEAVALP